MKKNAFIVIMFCVTSFLHGSAAQPAAASSGVTAIVGHNGKEAHEKAKNAIQFRIDRYTERRGKPKMIELHCSYCKGWVISYQKDGPGRLLRCYLDRIHAPQDLAKLQDDAKLTQETLPWLKCPKAGCGRFLGAPFLYKFKNNKTSEVRLSYRLLLGRTYLQQE